MRVRHGVVDIQARMSSVVRRQLLSEGIRLLEWLEGDLYLASFDPDGAFAAGPRQAASRLPIRSATSLPAEAKISDWLVGNDSPTWAKSEWMGQDAYDLVAVVYGDVAVADAESAIRAAGWGILGSSAEFHRIRVRVPQRELFVFADLDFVQHVEPIAPPKQAHDNAVSASMLHADQLHGGDFNLTGKDVRIAIWDGGRVYLHPDLMGRVLPLEPIIYFSDHATHVAGTMAGSGQSDPALKGIAPEARIYTGSFQDDVAEKALSAISTHETVLANNSWGFGMSGAACNMFPGTYPVEARDFDQVIRDHPMTMVFSAGNDRDGYSCPIFPTRSGFYSMGVPASAKNVISVGANNREFAMSDFSNYGPTRDGRLKPDISALGVDVRSLDVDGSSFVASGTSMSAPAITGSLALLVQRMREKHNMPKPPPALLKGILLNTAKDLGNIGPDYTFGYGIPDLVEAVRVIDSTQFQTQDYSGGEWTHTISVPGDAKALRVMAVWSDPPGPLNQRAVLVNDLDLTVTGPDGGEARLPLTLDPYKPSLPAAPGVNRRDNVEQVVLLSPAPGDYTIRLNSHRLTTDTQPVALVWSFAEVAVPPCSTVVSPAEWVLPEIGGSFSVGVTHFAHCEPATLENPSHWITSASEPKLETSGTLKFTAAPNNEEGTRHTMLRMGAADMRFRQSGPCRIMPFPDSREVSEELTLNDCVYLGTYTRKYTFHAEAGQKVSVLMEASDFEPWMELRSPNGTLLGTSDYWDLPDARIPELAGMITLPNTGEYTVVASSWEEATGPFHVKVEFGENGGFEARPDVPVLISECPYENTGTLGDSSTDGGVRGDLYLTNSYIFRGHAGQRIEVIVDESEFDAYLYLIAPNGSIASQNDDFSAGVSQLTGTLGSGGDWRIEVSSFSPFATGNYRLQVKGCSPRTK